MREGFETSGSSTHMMPLIIGDAEQAVRVAEAAEEEGVFAQAIRPPEVPAITSRPRLAVRASHTPEELRDAAQALARAAERAGIRSASRIGS